MPHKTLVEVTTKTLVTVYANTAKEAEIIAKDIVSAGNEKPYSVEAVIQAVEEEEVDTVLVFSDRQKLENLFVNWCKENDAAECSLNVVTFLHINGLINEEKALEFIKNQYVSG